jgi:hypothetical protein
MTCYKEFGRNLITSFMCVVLWVEHKLNICNVPEKFGEFSFPSILILFTCTVLNSSNKLLKSGTSFWLALYYLVPVISWCVCLSGMYDDFGIRCLKKQNYSRIAYLLL